MYRIIFAILKHCKRELICYWRFLETVDDNESFVPEPCTMVHKVSKTKRCNFVYAHSWGVEMESDVSSHVLLRQTRVTPIPAYRAEESGNVPLLTDRSRVEHFGVEPSPPQDNSENIVKQFFYRKHKVYGKIRASLRLS